MEEYRLNRHLKLSEENSTQLNRVAFFTVAIALALIVKVLTPFVDLSQDKQPIVQQVEALKTDKNTANEKIAVIEQVEATLIDINMFIEAQSWQQEKDKLIRRYRTFRNTQPTAMARNTYQDEADKTIRAIGTLLRENIGEALQRSLPPSSGSHLHLTRLHTESETLGRFIAQWEREYIGKQWYTTLTMKQAAMSNLTTRLNRRLNAFASVVRDELKTVKRKRTEVDQQLQQLD